MAIKHLNTEQQIAQHRIKEFERKVGQRALHLAYHAALPVVLNVEFVHLLRINFFLDPPEPLDYTAEFDLLLSPLCREIGDGFYEIDPVVRDELLKGLLRSYGGQDRFAEIGELLRQYSGRSLPWRPRLALERAQELTALDALDHPRALQWLEQAETASRISVKGERAWFVAMRQELERKEHLEREVSEAALWQEFYFDVLTVNEQGEEIERQHSSARQFSEDLGNGVFLEVVQIPGGKFLMGSPKDEQKRYDDESPQHEVTVSPFCMGKYPITQAQWQAVAALPQIERELKPEPSNFKGAQRPVENVSWHDAVEFCQRLSQQTGREYRLPSEAEWEYACRAGTMTPFHFGPTITTDLANYRGTDDKNLDWSGSYGKGPKGEYRKETTPVGYFQIANGFGLYDMHGNVWEWCADPWHDNYEGAPSDGRVWEEGGDSERRLLRGGSWFSYPHNCRCAYRYPLDPALWYVSRGFRVVVVFGGRTLL